MQSVLSLLDNEWVRDGVIVLGAYTLGRVGLAQAYQDIKNVVSGIKGAVSGAKAAVTATTTPTASS